MVKSPSRFDKKKSAPFSFLASRPCPAYTFALLVRRLARRRFMRQAAVPGAYRVRLFTLENEMEESYKPSVVESRWQKTWQDKGVFRVTEDPGKPQVLRAGNVSRTPAASCTWATCATTASATPWPVTSA